MVTYLRKAPVLHDRPPVARVVVVGARHCQRFPLEDGVLRRRRDDGVAVVLQRHDLGVLRETGNLAPERCEPEFLLDACDVRAVWAAVAGVMIPHVLPDPRLLLTREDVVGLQMRAGGELLAMRCLPCTWVTTTIMFLTHTTLNEHFTYGFAILFLTLSTFGCL